MSRLDALLVEEQDARQALERRLDELGLMVADCRSALSRGRGLPVQTVPFKAAAVEEASRIWDATRWAVADARQADRGVG